MRFLFVFSFAVLMAGCAAQRGADLEKTLDYYRRALQMRDEQMMVSMVKPEHREQVLKKWVDYKNLQIAHFEVTKINPDKDLSEAAVLYSMEYFSKDDMLLKTNHFFMNWSYDKKLSVWLLNEESPLGRRASTNP